MKQFFSNVHVARAKRVLLLGILSLLVGWPEAWAQTVTIGSTTVPVVAPAVSDYFYGPIYRSANDAGSTFNWSRYAYLYTAAELGIPTGAVITQLGWLKSDGGIVNGNNTFNVLLENSSLTTLGTTQTWGALAATPTTVYASTTQQVNGVAGTYLSVTLSQPFVYTGGNLLVLTDWQKQGSALSAVNFVTNLATGLGLGYANSAALTNNTALTSSYGNRRPTMQVTYTPGGPCTAPPTAGTTVASATTVCAGTSINLTLTGASYGAGQTYQWQESTNGTTFTNIAGATLTNYAIASVQATRTYRAQLTCSGQSATSTPVTVTLNPASYATLPVAESFEGTWISACNTNDVPSNSWRTTPSSGDAAWRRDDDGTSAAWTSPTIGVYAPTGSQGSRSARFHSYYAGAGALGTLDLYVNLTAAGNKVLQFDYLNTAGNDSLQVQVSTDGGLTFGAPLVRLGISGTAAAGWQPQSVSLTSTSATTVVRFRTKVTTAFTSDIGLDNVRLNLLTGVPTCATNFLPATGAVNQSRNTTISWQAGTGVVTGYDVYFGTTATPPLVSTNQPGTTYTAPTLLAPNATYYYQIVPRNANGSAVSCGVQSFTTNNVPVYCDPSTTFLSGFCGANNITEVTVAGSGLNALGLTCNSITTSTGANAYTSYPVSGTTTGTLLRGLTYPVTVNNNGSSILSVWIDFNQNGIFEASEWTQLATSTTANTAVTVNVTVPVTAVLGLTGMRVRSRGTGNQNGAGDACLTFGGGETKDFVVTIGAAPACAPAAGLAALNITTTTATLSFSTVTNGTAANYVVQYGPAGFTPGGANSTTVNTTTTSTPITGLTANTSYQFYVTKDCGGGQTSQIAGPFTFRTACVPATYAPLPIIESFENTWADVCDTHDAPNLNWRTTPNTGNSSWRREDDGASAAWTSPTLLAYTPAGSQGIHSARFHSYYAGAGATGSLDLFANLSTAGTKRLSFDYINTAGNDSLLVEVSNDGGNTLGPPIARLGISGAQGWVSQAVILSGTSATSIIRFRGKVTTTFTTDYGLDNVRVEATSGCLTPVSLAASGLTATTATLSWVSGGAGTFTVFYGPTGFNPAQASSSTNVYTTVPGIAGSSYTLTGLSPSTAYQFYVVQNCTGSTTSSTGGPLAFTTACVTPVYANLPLTESFENTWLSRCDINEVPSNSWRNTPGTGNNSWRREDDGTSAGWTSPTIAGYTPAASQGLHSARFHTYYALSGTIGTFDLFANLSAAGAKRLSFDFVNTSGADSLVVQLSNDGGVTFTRLAGYNLSATFTTQVLPITSTSATAVIRFRARSDYGVTDIGLDNIILESATGCLTPASLTATTTTTTASLSWLTGGTGTYTVLYGPTGFNPAQASSSTNFYTTASGLVAPPYAITGLTPGTTYQFYVILNCAGGTNSGTAGPGSFTTQIINDDPCGATTLTVTNTCTPVATTTIGASTTNAISFGYTNPGTCAGGNTTPLDVWFKFTTAATGPTSTAVRISVTGNPASVVRGFSGAACTGPLTSLGCVGTAANTAAPNLDLTGLTPNTTYYVSVSNYSSFTYTLGNFTICATPVPNCPPPTALTAATVTSTTATLSWSATAGNTYTVIYGPTGFTPPTGGTIISGLTTASTALTGLTPGVTYQFYVQQVCGGFNGSSALAGPVAFTTPLTAPANDEPCGAIALLNTVTQTGTNVGATTSVGNGIALTGLPVCTSNANAPKDVWYTFTPASPFINLTFTGSAVGSVRLFALAGTCPSGTFTQVGCQAATGANVGLTAASFSNLVVGTRYYLAVAGYASGDTQGSFTITSAFIPLGTHAQAETNALVVYPNPSNTGQLTLRLSTPTAGSATLLNALGQVVLTKNLTTGTTEQVLATKGLATGVYTLRVQQGNDVLTRKVVLE